MAAVWIAILTVGVIALVAGLGLSYASRRLPASDDELVEQVNELLPQTQCAQCRYPGCRPYAQAIISAGAPINLCPPGGDDTVRRLAELLSKEPMPLAEPQPEGRSVASIDEALCIGCTHCRSACPVDAIELTYTYDIVGLTRQEMIFDKEKLLAVYDATIDRKPM